MAKRRRNVPKFDKKVIISIILLIISFVTYFHLFFIGNIIYEFIQRIIGNAFFLLLIIDSYALLCLLKYEKKIKNYELIGAISLYVSINLLANQSIIAISTTKILSVIITENLTKLLYFIVMILSIILLLLRFKNIIYRELNLKIKETNTQISTYRSSVEQQKEQEFLNLSQENIKIINYITNFTKQSSSTSVQIINKIPQNLISEYANSIYQYIDDIKSALIKIFSLNEQDVYFAKEVITIEKISLIFYTKEIVNKRQMVNKIKAIIPGCSVEVKDSAWKIDLNYKSNILLAIKNMIINTLNKNRLTLGITNQGNILTMPIGNVFINFENLTLMSSYLDIIFFQKTFNHEKFAIIDFKNEILLNLKNKENVLYEVINTKKQLYSLLLTIENDILEKRNYASDRGYDSYQNYISAKKINYDKINIVFHEISTISLNERNFIYRKLLALTKHSSQYGYNFIFTNSKESKDVIKSQIYLLTKNKLFFETYSNSFSKLLTKTKLLKTLNKQNCFYYLKQEQLIKIYFPCDDSNYDYISNLIEESLEKEEFKKEKLENMLIVEELKIKQEQGDLITLTFIMTKYKVKKVQAQEILNKLQKMR